VSLVLLFVYPITFLSDLSQISFFLAFFNLLPIHPLDGSKIIIWNMKIWLIVLAVSLIGLIFIGII